jgi:hypothetical protein
MVNPDGFAVEMQFSGPSGEWTDVTRDVRSAPRIRAKYGMAGVSPLDRVASTGELVFAMDNSAGNSAGKVGYYSPGHRECRPGFGYSIGVRWRVTWLGVPYYKFRGVLDSIQPVAGAHRERLTDCVVVDWMDEAARYRVRGIAAQLDSRANELIFTIVSLMPLQPADASSESGIDVFPYALDTTKDGKTTALTEFQKIAISELAYLYVKGDTTQGGTLVFENRHHRSNKVTNAVTLSDTMVELEALRDRDDLLNHVTVTVRPRRVGGSTVVLFTLDSTVVVPPNGASFTISCPYSDPDNNAEQIGGINMIDPVAVTDYTAVAEWNNTVSLTNYITVSANFGGNSADVTFTNAHPTDAAVMDFFQLRGEGLFAFTSDAVLLESEDTASQDALGENGLSFEMPYQADPNVGQGAANYLRHLYSDPTTIVRGVSFIANTDSTLMTAALAREIGDRVGIEETVTGVTDDVEWLDQDFEVAQTVTSLRQTSSFVRFAQGFKCNPGAITKIAVPLQRIGSPSGSVWMQIEADSGGNPSGTALATSRTIRSIDIQAGDLFWTEFGFAESGRYTVTSSATQYHFVLYSDTPINGSDYFRIESAINSFAYANGDGKRYNGSTWSLDNDINFRLYLHLTAAVRGYFINAIELDFQQPSLLTCRWALTPADRQRYWNLGTAGATELGATTVLAYV